MELSGRRRPSLMALFIFMTVILLQVTPTSTVSSTVTPTSTLSSLVTPTSTLSSTVTPTSTVSSTVTPTSTLSSTVTPTSTVSSTVTPSATVTFTADVGVSATVSFDMTFETQDNELLVFTDDLNDPTSARFIELQTFFCRAMVAIIRTRLPSDVGDSFVFVCVVNRFRSGSVIANGDVEMEAPAGAITPAQVEDVTSLDNITAPKEILVDGVLFGIASLNSNVSMLTATEAPTAVATAPSAKYSSISTGAIVGIVLGCLAFIMIVLIVFCFCFIANIRHHQKNKMLMAGPHHPDLNYHDASLNFLDEDDLHPDDLSSGSSLEDRRFVVGQALRNMGQPRYPMSEYSQEGSQNFGAENYMTPYVVDGMDGEIVERNPLHVSHM